MAKSRIKVLCVDDHQFMAEGLRTKIDLASDVEFVGWIDSAENLIREVREKQPDIVVLDIEMPGPDPFESLQDMQSQFPDVRTIMLSAYVRDHYIDTAFSRGAWGYLSKSDTPDDVIAAIRKVRNGQFAFGPKVLERCQPALARGIRSPKKKKSPSTKLQLLTQREQQILRMIGKGLSRTEIADAIKRSPKTVDNHRASIMEKLDIRDRVELARYALKEGITEL